MIKRKLGEILIRETGRSRDMGFVTITDVTVTRDLGTANVYFSIIGGKKKLDKQINIVENMGKRLRHQLASAVVLKYIPRIKMIYDITPVKAQKIETILKIIEDGRS
ncbi:MAG: ribosome-binding factor A [Elusimicrobia bacterium]|nr:ribosome-binding factor A [Elusimicrobiota bacterium]